MQLAPLSEFDYHATLARTHGASLVLFGSPGCGTCRKVENLLPEAAGSSVAALFKVDVQQDGTGAAIRVISFARAVSLPRWAFSRRATVRSHA